MFFTALKSTGQTLIWTWRMSSCPRTNVVDWLCKAISPLPADYNTLDRPFSVTTAPWLARRDSLLTADAGSRHCEWRNDASFPAASYIATQSTT